MGQGTLVREEIDAGAELVRRFDQFAPVCAALWMRPDEESEQRLYVSSEQITDLNMDLAYGEVSRILREMNDPNLDPFRVRLVRADHPLVRGVLVVYSRYPGPKAIHFNGRHLGDAVVDDAYIYPQIQRQS